MNVQGDAEAGHEWAERKVRGVLRGLLVPVVLALELELLTARRTSGDAEGVGGLPLSPAEGHGCRRGEDPTLDKAAGEGCAVAPSGEGLIGLDHSRGYL